MPLRRKIRDAVVDEAQEIAGRRFIDLGKLIDSGPGRHKGGFKTEIKIAEIDSFDDLRYISNIVYDGHILIIDFTAMSNDELSLRRVISELQRLAEDVNGDIAGLGNNYIIITPRGIGVNKQKMRRGSMQQQQTGYGGQSQRRGVGGYY